MSENARGSSMELQAVGTEEKAPGEELSIAGGAPEVSTAALRGDGPPSNARKFRTTLSLARLKWRSQPKESKPRGDSSSSVLLFFPFPPFSFYFLDACLLQVNGSPAVRLSELFDMVLNPLLC